MYVSKCCREKLKVEGFCTRYYVCNKCGMACDITEYRKTNKKRANEVLLAHLNGNGRIENIDS